jgi:hypothetical protein
MVYNVFKARHRSYVAHGWLKPGYKACDDICTHDNIG